MSSSGPDTRRDGATARVLVVAAAVVDDLATPTRVLAARRRSPPALAGLWEFPGGKVEAGEDPVTALHRELAEELHIAVDLGPELLNLAGSCWPISAELEMRVWLVSIRSGMPRAAGSHDDLRWVGPDELDGVAWLPADTDVAVQLMRLLAPQPGTPSRETHARGRPGTAPSTASDRPTPPRPRLR